MFRSRPPGKSDKASPPATVRVSTGPKYMDHARPRPLLLILALALAFPATASANAGTALLGVVGLHLILGNLCLGVVEGLLLAQFTRCRVWRAVILMIVANYVSAWAGYALVGRIKAGADITVENVSPWLAALVPAAFVITVLLEFAFVLFALRGTERPVRQATRGTLLVNGISLYSARRPVLAGWRDLVREGTARGSGRRTHARGGVCGLSHVTGGRQGDAPGSWKIRSAGGGGRSESAPGIRASRQTGQFGRGIQAPDSARKRQPME